MKWVSVTHLCEQNHIGTRLSAQVAGMLKRRGVKHAPFRNLGKFSVTEARAEMPAIIETLRKKAARPGSVGKPHPQHRSPAKKGPKKVANGLDTSPAQLELFETPKRVSPAHSISARLARLEKKVDTLIALWS